jgi:molybdopterin-containing oxidoreductase family membrane subunit
VAVIVSVGMWLERFVIIVTSLSRDYMPSAWAMYHPTVTDLAIYFGTIGFFFLLFVLFIRVLPAISIAEVRELILHHGHSASFADQTAHETAHAD